MMHKLMENNITRDDLDKVINFLKKKNVILTQSKNVHNFEEKWSKWLGVKYSVFVNSGSSANLITISVLKEKFGNNWEIIVPSFTWISDIASVLQFGFKPIFVDIDPYHLGMDNTKIIEQLNKNTKAVFLTHVQGFNGLSDELLKEYGFELTKTINAPYDAIIVAVNHKDYLSLDEKYFKSILSEKGVLVDIKGIYKDTNFDLDYWTL